MTNQVTVWEDGGLATINGEVYKIVRPSGQQNMMGELSYKVELSDEPPWTEGAPSLVNDPQFTWHLGGFKSRQGIPGTSEYGKNSDDRWAFRMLPSAKINTVSLPSSASTPTSIFEALGYVFIVCGRRVYRLDPATDTVVLSKDFGVGTTAIMGTRWEQDFALVTTSENSNSLYKLATSGIVVGGPDTWTTSDVTAYMLAAGINRLFKVSKTGELRNIVTGLDPMVEDNWADQVQVGETSTIPTALVSYERTVFVGKPEGLFGVGDDGFGMPLIKRMAREDSNCSGAISYDPWLIVPHVRGLYRFVPGLVEAIGLEKELLNQSPLNGRWKAFAPDSEWLYGLMDVDGDTYVNVARDRHDNESGFSPVVWDTWLFFEAESRAAFISALSTTPRLYMGYGNDLTYVKLGNSTGAVEYSTAGGSRFLTRMRFDDWNPKDFPKIDVVGKNCSLTKYWQVNYSIDGAAYSSLDINGADMKVTSDTKFTFELPTDAVGREIQYRLDWVSDDATTPPELLFVEAFARPQSKKSQVIVVYLALEDGTRHNMGMEARPPLTQLNDLLELTESASSFVTTGPWGEDVSAWAHKLRVAGAAQAGLNLPTFYVELALQLR